MVDWPSFNEAGDLPAEILKATLAEVLAKFGGGTAQRRAVGMRLARIHKLATATGHVRRFVVYGSFVTTKPEPNDVDVFLVMEDDFDFSAVAPEMLLVFDHMTAHNALGASVFWVRRLAALGGEDSAVRDWMHKRDGSLRGVVEVVDDQHDG